MSSVILNGDTSGAITLATPTVAGTNTITLPAVTGTAVVAGQNSAITAATAQASTSGTSIDFTSIPSWVKRVTVMFNGVSLSGSAYIRIQAGVSGTPTTTGYSSYSSLIAAASAVNSIASTSGIDLFGTNASYTISGALRFQNVTGNVWVIEGVTSSPVSGTYTQMSAGSITLSGTLGMIRITTSNGTDTFDAGSINILYE